MKTHRLVKYRKEPFTLHTMVFLTLIIAMSSTACAAALKPIVLDERYEHNKWGTLPQDTLFHFAAYTSSFDSADDNNDKGEGDCWGIPEWVAFEIKGNQEEHKLDDRPTWITDTTLHDQGVAPNDDTYHVSGTRKMKRVKDDYRFVRGHMCPKDTAERISEDAAYNTHTIMNACPQLQWQNNGIWKELEQKCVAWADTYERIWVVCGPVFFAQSPAMWLGQEGEVKAAIPDAFFKIVIKENGASVDTLSFLLPNILPKQEDCLNDFLCSIDHIESLTGLDFLSALEEDVEACVEKNVGERIDW